MLKNPFISFQEKKEENRGLLNFKYSISPIRYEDLLHIWNFTEKTIYLREVYGKFWENVNDYCLICKKK